MGFRHRPGREGLPDFPFLVTCLLPGAWQLGISSAGGASSTPCEKGVRNKTRFLEVIRGKIGAVWDTH